MDFLLTVIGFALLAVSLTGIVFGIFMAINATTRDAGKYLALWWVPGAAAATGVIMKDVVTFAIGFACFCVAGLVFAYEARKSRSFGVQRPGYNSGKKRRRGSERTTAENEKRNYRRRAS
ncbi:MAG: hypothetical protein ACRDSJ_22330 [Rubrobacteraceae bacterium]